MADQDPTQYKRLSVDEIQELAGEALPERVALSLFNAGVGVMPMPIDDVIATDPIKSDDEFVGPPGFST